MISRKVDLETATGHFSETRATRPSGRNHVAQRVSLASTLNGSLNDGRLTRIGIAVLAHPQTPISSASRQKCAFVTRHGGLVDP
jgi:hypothetical protein